MSARFENCACGTRATVALALYKGHQPTWLVCETCRSLPKWQGCVEVDFPDLDAVVEAVGRRLQASAGESPFVLGLGESMRGLGAITRHPKWAGLRSVGQCPGPHAYADTLRVGGVAEALELLREFPWVRLRDLANGEVGTGVLEVLMA